MNFTLPEWIHNLPPWLNLKVMGAVVIIGAGLWLLFRTLGEIVKLLIALALIGAGVWIIARVMGWL